MPKSFHNDNHKHDIYGMLHQWHPYEYVERELVIPQKSIYLALPFFSKNQMSKVLKIEKALKNNLSVGRVYSPRYDQMGSDYNPKTQTYEWANWIYRQDMTEVKYADIILGIFDFDKQDIDSGTAYEGALGKPFIAVNLDHYSANLMLVIGSDYELRSIKAIQEHDFNKAASWQYQDPIYLVS